MTSNSDQKFVPFNPISINGQDIDFSDQAEHVGVIRSPDGNLPHILNRIVAHKRAMGAVLFSGLARSHRGNPAASLKIEKLRGMPVLFSGMASLVLDRTEVNIIDQHYTTTMRNLLKVCYGTPKSFVLFMSGSLPGEALFHLRMLSLFGMISRLPNDPLNVRARHVLITSKSTSKSWFSKLRDICLQYRLPHPLTLLETPLSKYAFKKLTKSLVIDYWEQKLRLEAAILPSLSFFKPDFHSLTSPHPIFWTAGSNPYEVSKAIIQSRMLSGRYRTAVLTKHWSSDRSGFCQATCCFQIEESLEHILLGCPQYAPVREKLIRLWLNTTEPRIHQLVTSLLVGPRLSLLQFILDASVNSTVITLRQKSGTDPLKIIFHLTRTWCYTIHRERAKMLGNFSFA